MVIVDNISLKSTCVPWYEKINTEKWSINASAVRIGDKLWTTDNWYPVLTEVEKISSFHSKNIITIELDNWVSLDVTWDHPIATKWNIWKEAQDLTIDDECIYINPKYYNWQNYTAKIWRSLGYYIWAIAADWSIQDDRRICLEVNDEWFAKKVQKACLVAFWKEAIVQKISKPSWFLKRNIIQYRHRITSWFIWKCVLNILKMRRWLWVREKTCEFRLPDLFKSNKDFRDWFLEWYIDWDWSNKWNTWWFSIVSKNKIFLEQLWQSLGVKVSKHKDSEMYSIYYISNKVADLWEYKKYNTTTWEDKHWFSKDFKIDWVWIHEFVKIKSITKTQNTRVYSFKTSKWTFNIRGVLTHNCEHHFQNIIWICHVAYIPDKLVIWLSKIPRIVRYYSKRPQIQERLTEQIHSKLCEILETKDIAVIIKAEHHCMKCRGIEEQNSKTTTSKMWGAFQSPETRAEFYNLLNNDS